MRDPSGPEIISLLEMILVEMRRNNRGMEMLNQETIEYDSEEVM